jgi:hypothetical protein
MIKSLRGFLYLKKACYRRFTDYYYLISPLFCEPPYSRPERMVVGEVHRQLITAFGRLLDWVFFICHSIRIFVLIYQLISLSNLSKYQADTILFG